MIKKIFILLFAITMLLGSSTLAASASASTADEAAISAEDDKYVPLYTKSPDSISGDISQFESSSRDSNLYYTQTTFLALLVGYLILFKVKGIRNKEKLHRRKNKINKE